MNVSPVDYNNGFRSFVNSRTQFDLRSSRSLLDPRTLTPPTGATRTRVRRWQRVAPQRGIGSGTIPHMARTMIEQLTDDLDGSKADGTLTFAVNGTNYEIELSRKNRAAFDKLIAPYVEHARKVRGSAAGARRPANTGGKRSDLAEIRTWALDNGYEVSARGRIAAEVVEAYDAAH